MNINIDFLKFVGNLFSAPMIVFLFHLKNQIFDVSGDGFSSGCFMFIAPKVLAVFGLEKISTCYTLIFWRQDPKEGRQAKTLCHRFAHRFHALRSTAIHSDIRPVHRQYPERGPFNVSRDDVLKAVNSYIK